MAGTEFEKFIQDEIQRDKGVLVPVKAGRLERLLVRKVACKKMHPNPEDEFCFPDIGPNLGIIQSYVTQFRTNMDKDLPLMDEPLYLQKVKPSGYLLLNGHHRWAAALRLGIKKVPVSIVNGVFESDIRVMLERSTHEKRATLDLDEVIFQNPKDSSPKKSPFIIQKKRLRKGVPALFSFLKKNGYDIWVYSANYYSIDDVQRYFKRYSANVDGIITGMKKKKSSEASREVENMIADKYNTTLHIDNDLLLITHKGSGEFEERQINCAPDEWSKEVITALEDLEKK